jgi:hypothetical protein
MGGPTPLLRHEPASRRRHRHARAFRQQHIQKLTQSKTRQVLAWCPSCVMQFGRNRAADHRARIGEKPFDMTPFMPFLHGKLDKLLAVLEEPSRDDGGAAPASGIAGVMEAAEQLLLGAVPGIRIVKLDVPAVGLQSVNLATLPKFKAELQLRELEAARKAGVDALVAVYHSDHRELCAHERDWPFKIMNILEVVGESMGFRQDDHYKNLKVKQDVDAIISDAG